MRVTGAIRRSCPGAPRRATAAVAVSAAVLAGAGACSSGAGTNGEEKKTPAQISSDAQAALRNAASVRVAGTLTDTGSGSGGTTTFDLHFHKGVGAYGTMSNAGQTLQLIRLGNDLYVKGAGAAQLGPTAAGLVGNRYVKLSATSGIGKDLASSIDLSSFVDDLTLSDTSGVRRSTLDGRKAVVLTDKGDGVSTLYVADSGSPVPLRLAGSGSTGGGTMSFTDYGADVTIAAPAAAVTLPAGT
jgi:hypothetical protein